ncbi:hypothetical protein [Paraburkholderia sp. DHOC27]|uniref:hypothetical protein n=1 Tax=Paraburkholderia sp. DHOC27 TaxID=2303330 RepID=UPI000E3B7755|nr:hypothetical protein [Paraburkholderia sp. DHOC27]RFU47598.1 hypothetical protein D0B32_08490 [Paraburkholderia sp. DHOC27]
MENNRGSAITALKNAPVFVKTAISLYALAVLQYLVVTLGGLIFMMRPVSRPAVPLDALFGIAALLLAFGVLKAFLAFKLFRRKNWARIVVVIVSALVAALLIQGAIVVSKVDPHASFNTLTHNYGLVAEIAAALLLLLPQSKGWFVPKRASA